MVKFFNLQRTDECFGHASTTEFTVDIRHLLEELDVINERNHKILHGTERVLKRNPGLTTQEYIYQKKEKKGSTRTNALIQLGNEMIFAGRQFGEATTYGGFHCGLVVTSSSLWNFSGNRQASFHVKLV